MSNKHTPHGLRRRVNHCIALSLSAFLALLSNTTYAKTTFNECSDELGLDLGNSAAGWADYNNDGWVDLCAGGVLWQNEKGKSFSKVTTLGAGVFADFDNDGCIDLFAGNFAHDDSRGHQPQSRFLRNSGPGSDYVFEDKGQCGVYYQESYASPAAGDYDNDGDLDLFFTTVYGTASFGKANYPVLFRNDGSWSFADVTGRAGLAKLGPTYQAAWADFDNDGDLDLVTAGKLFVNQGDTNCWLKVRLVGDGKIVNRSAIGSQARIKLKDRILTRQVEAGTGEGNQNEMTLHFGLGGYSGPVNIEIFWAGGFSQTVNKIKPNQLVTVTFDLGNTVSSDSDK